LFQPGKRSVTTWLLTAGSKDAQSCSHQEGNSMSKMISDAVERLLARLNDPSHQDAAENAAGLVGEFKEIEREWKELLQPGPLKEACQRLRDEIQRQEGLLADEAAEALFARREAAHIIGKSARLMALRRMIEREYP
jgi:hypothetical protein